MTEEIPIINEVHTACLDCVFSIKDKQKQIGCKFNRLELYEKAGAEIIKAYDAHNNEFDVINMRICMYKRSEVRTIHPLASKNGQRLRPPLVYGFFFWAF